MEGVIEQLLDLVLPPAVRALVRRKVEAEAVVGEQLTETLALCLEDLFGLCRHRWVL
jgi:hypothetical protein